MTKGITILVADRNPHVREFLKRELVTEGYRVTLAGNGQDLLGYLESRQGIDLLVLDPDLPYTGERGILEEIRGRVPVLPVVLHTELPEYVNHPATLNNATLVEKKGNSVDRLKRVISAILNHPVPRFLKTHQTGGSRPSHR